MALDIEYFQKINNTYGTSNKKETQLYQLKNHINDRFSDTIDCYNVAINDINQDLIITRTTNHSIKSIKVRPFEDINVGDYVKWEDTTWIIIDKDLMNQEYSRGKMQLTNHVIKFQSPDGTILSYPCITSNKSFNEDAGKVITLPVNQKYISLPFDENTVMLKNNEDKTWRFFVDKNPLNPTPYKIIGDPDTTTYNYGDKGLIELLVEQDELQNDDRVDLGVCDYVEPSTTPEPPDPTILSVIVNIISDTINNKLKLGLNYNFNAEITNELGEVITNTQPVFSIDNNYGGLVVLTDNGNGTATIKVKNDAYDLLTKQLKLTCMDMYSGFSSYILLTIVGLF